MSSRLQHSTTTRRVFKFVCIILTDVRKVVVSAPKNCAVLPSDCVKLVI